MHHGKTTSKFVTLTLKLSFTNYNSIYHCIFEKILRGFFSLQLLLFPPTDFHPYSNSIALSEGNTALDDYISHNKILKDQWGKQQKFIFLQF